jgi:hypothetical protein
MQIDVYSVSDTEKPVVTVSVPESMSLTELPDMILFATKELFDQKRDSLQIFRRQINSDVNDPVPFQIKPNVTVKTFFISDQRIGEFRVYYDIIRGFTPEQLKNMVIRTCDVYDQLFHRQRRVRFAMRAADPLSQFAQYLLRFFPPGQVGRLLIEDDDGVVTPVKMDAPVPVTAILRFEVVPRDQMMLKDGEFLVTALLCRLSKGQMSAVSLGKSFLFKVVPDELVELARERIREMELFESRWIPYVTLWAGQRILNEDEVLASMLRPGDVVKIVLPDRVKAIAILKKAGIQPTEKMFPYD